MLRSILTLDHFNELLSCRTHASHIRRHRAQIISERVVLVSRLLAILTPLWIVVDMAVQPWPTWGYLALMRLLCAAAFLGLTQVNNERRGLNIAFLMLGAMTAIPPVGFLAVQPFLVNAAGDELTQVAVSLYTLIPFIMVAGLSIFPLTLIETLTASLSILIMLTLGEALQGQISLHDMVLGGWMFMLLVGVSAFSGMSQLHYIVSLVNQASLDVLTGAFTRRSGEETLQLHFRIAASTAAHFTLLFIDIDKFKSVNDEHGHEAGDVVLRQVAQSLMACLRKSDVLVRWGGEEFVVILPNTDSAGTQQVLKRIAMQGLGNRPEGRKITVSIGVAEKRIDHCDDWDRLLELADKRMYESKESGRNRSTGYDNATNISQLIDISQ